MDSIQYYVLLAFLAAIVGSLWRMSSHLEKIERATFMNVDGWSTLAEIRDVLRSIDSTAEKIEQHTYK